MPLAVGSRLGPYQIVAALGTGGMGEVYRGRDTRLDRVVALKVLPAPVAAAPGWRERFEREARAISAVEHPHICPLYDVGTDGGVDFLVMQYVEGETLARRIERGPIPPAEACALARQIASGLEAAHERGIVHRDLKPSNIQLTPDGQVKLLDFGLAKFLTSAAEDLTGLPTAGPDPTHAGAILGTAPYMSPEQAQGKPVDKRTDIWAFGCVLFEMLSGGRAFAGPTLADVLAAVIGRDPDWTTLPAATPRRVRDLLRRCLRKDPARRLRDVGDARLELEEAEAEEPDTPTAEEGKRRSPVVAWSVAGLALLIAGAALLRARSAPGDGRSAMRFSVVTNFSGVEAQPSLSPDGRSVAFISNRDGQWDLYVGLVTGGSLIRITDDPNLETRPRWSPDGSRLLFARLNDNGINDIWVVPALGGASRRVLVDGQDPAWSPDGSLIAYSARGAIAICDASGANPRTVTRPERLFHLQPAFSHDGRSLALVQRVAGPYGDLAVADLRTGSVRALTEDGAAALSPVWSPDDRYVYFTSSRGGTLNVWKIPAAGGRPTQITAGRGDEVDLDLSPDGRRLVFSSFRSNLNLAERSLEASRSETRWLTTDAARNEGGPRYSPDGLRIAYFSSRSGGERENIWLMEADGRGATTLVDDGLVNVFPRWSGDGREVLFAARRRGLLGQLRPELRRVAVGGGAPQVLPITPGPGSWGDVSPDGSLLYRTSSRGGELYEPRTRARQPVADLFGDPLWSRDGRSFGFMVGPDVAASPEEAGVWVGTLEGARKQVFRGWVVWFAWGRAHEIFVLEGKPGLSGVLWRSDTEGRREAVLSGIPLPWRLHDTRPIQRFDVHPDGRRIVLELFESLESDLSLIDDVL